MPNLPPNPLPDSPEATAQLARQWTRAMWNRDLWKQVSWLGACLVLAACLFLLLTAKKDEEECSAHFGAEYRSYMLKTKRFIPFLF